MLRAEADRSPSDAPVSVGNPLDYRDGSRLRQLMRYSRMVTIYAGSITFFAIGLAIAFVGLFPLKTVEVKYVYFDDVANQIVTVWPGQIDKSTRDIFTENTLRQYVQYRETIDYVTEADRYAWVQLHTDEAAFAAWRNQNSPQNPNSPLRKYHTAGLTREIFVTSVAPTEYSRGIYQVEFTAIDRAGSEERRRTSWNAIVQVGYRAYRDDENRSADNPLGITVYSYNIRPRTLAEANAAAAPITEGAPQ